MYFLTKMLFKEFFIWAFWGQNVGPCWFQNGQKGFFYTSHPILPKNEVLNSHIVLIL